MTSFLRGCFFTAPFLFSFFSFEFYYMRRNMPRIRMHKAKQYTEFFLRLYHPSTAIYCIFFKTHWTNSAIFLFWWVHNRDAHHRINSSREGLFPLKGDASHTFPTEESGFEKPASIAFSISNRMVFSSIPFALASLWMAFLHDLTLTYSFSSHLWSCLTIGPKKRADARKGQE